MHVTTEANHCFLLTCNACLQYGNGTLRLTTRQTYQLHGVLKQDLKTVFSSVIKNMGSTLAACGDVNRNVLASPAPYKNRPEYQYATQYANDIADLLAPQSGAYYDVWLDGEKFFSHEMEVGLGINDFTCCSLLMHPQLHISHDFSRLARLQSNCVSLVLIDAWQCCKAFTCLHC